MKIVRLHKCSCILEQRSFHSHAEVGNGSCLAILLITTGKRIRLGEFFFFFFLNDAEYLSASNLEKVVCS